MYLLHFSVVSCVQFRFLKMPGLFPYMTLIGTAVTSLIFTFVFVAALETPARWYAEATRNLLSGERLEAGETELSKAG